MPEASGNGEDSSISVSLDGEHLRVDRVDGTFVLEVRNDGATAETRGTGTGMGLRLAAFEAIQRGALVEFGPEGGDWRVRLVVPVEEDSEE